MKTALWETSTGALAALLNARGPLEKADLYTITLPGGAVLRWSGSDVAITGNSTTWALGPGLKRGRVRFTVGVEVDSLQVTLWDVVGTTINGKGLIAFIRSGGLLGARLQLDRAFWAPGDTQPRGALLWFTGRVAGVPEVGRYEAQIEVKSELELLDAMIPRDVYQAPCPNTLFDNQCGASRAAFTTSGTAATATDARRVTFSATLGQATGYFDLGVCTFTSGGNAGISRTVKTHVSGSPGAVTVLQPWPVAVQVGDAFTITAGCNKTQSGTNGCPKFHDAATVKLRFRGAPFIPVPETVA